MQTTDYTLNVGGRLMSLAQPQVMGILNLTPDSFYSGSRCEGEAVVRQRARQIVDEVEASSMSVPALHALVSRRLRPRRRCGGCAKA